MSAHAQHTDFTLRTNSRLVLTDVTVEDSHGNPVPGLKASDFEVFDNKTPENISSFEEHTTQPIAPAASPAEPGVYDNAFMQSVPPVLNVLLIDIKNIEIEDQMYLAHRLKQLIDTLPAGQPLAIYWCRRANTILLQSFTSDHALLLAAVHRAMPRFPPTGREFYSDFNSLQQIASDIGQLPARKNILWFTGGSTLYLKPEGGGFQAPNEDQEKMRAVFDELESSRIAIYPIDARGLTVVGATPSDSRLWAQHGQMNDVAEATGGKAFYSDNGLDKVVNHLLVTDGSFYSITYSPKSVQFDKRWHNVEVKLTRAGGPYRLSYRRGYFADGMVTSFEQARNQAKSGSRSLVNGGKVADDDPELRTEPILFKVAVHPASQDSTQLSAAVVALPYHSDKKSGTETYSLLYSVPLKDFQIKTLDGKPQASLGIAIIAFNDNGSIASRSADHVSVFIHPDKMSLAQNTTITVLQRINLPRGEDNLYCAVWDMTSHRVGTVRMPVTVPKSAGAAKGLH